MRPIFFAYTRSFLLGVIPVLAAGLDAIVALVETGNEGPITEFMAALFGLSPGTAESIVRVVGMVAGLLIAYERSGFARKYSTNPKDK